MINNQKGVSLIITFFITIIILGAVLSVSALLHSEIKVIRNVGNSVIAFYAADSGIEKVLYYDRQVLPTTTDGTTMASRGLCSMYLSEPVSSSGFVVWARNNSACIKGGSGDSSIYCAPVVNTPKALDSNIPQRGCDPERCDECEISFKTMFDNKTYYTYSVKAKVDKSNYLNVSSTGFFRGASRRIETFLPITTTP